MEAVERGKNPIPEDHRDPTKVLQTILAGSMITKIMYWM